MSVATPPPVAESTCRPVVRSFLTTWYPLIWKASSVLSFVSWIATTSGLRSDSAFSSSTFLDRTPSAFHCSISVLFGRCRSRGWSVACRERVRGWAVAAGGWGGRPAGAAWEAGGGPPPACAAVSSACACARHWRHTHSSPLRAIRLMVRGWSCAHRPCHQWWQTRHRTEPEPTFPLQFPHG